MHLSISGFFVNDSNNHSIQYELDIPQHSEHAVLEVMNWKSFAESPDGEFALSLAQVQKIEQVLQRPMPRELALYIGIEA
ncbi:hypothetical protein SAMN04487857_101345 [Pseudomonas sp. ok272]|uniref:pyocin S6 family toxin immunity protein n=1 Tax=unclassified Pseudomonas TaxID=196821 RepID=UPI0008B9F284|nr:MULTISPECIES: pyocin S6 family toxin immunity protein [unclassified Pseudomonas]SEM36067.1 hypothetical protein SAMN04487857_101345 [Pseudomonas sp. ok272]SFM36422.1 hypothetical protein SAMN04487858_102347 [Pseudomonas sp. ok602]